MWSLAAPTPRKGGVSDLIGTFQALYDDLLRMMTARTGNPDRAADIVQDTYFRLASAQAMGQVIVNPRAYVFRVASNLAIDDGRRVTRTRQRDVPEDETVALSDPQPLADAALLAKERLRLLDAALQQLPVKARQALLLNRVEGLTQREIAEQLGVSESMVTQYVAQALRTCRAWRRRVDA